MSVRLLVILLFASAGQAGTSLPELAEANDTAAVVRALRGGGAATDRSADGTTALHWAAQHGNVAMTTALIKAKADVNARNDYGATPLLEAAESSSVEVIRLLIKARADANLANEEGQSPLMTAARTGMVESANLLIKAGAKVNAKEGWRGQSALMWAAAQGNPQMVRLLLASGALANARSTQRVWARRVTSEPRPQNRPLGGLTALLLAAREGCVDCTRELLRKGANINLADPDNITPLVMAILNARFDVAAVLIEAGADVNRWDTWGRAPLYSAIDYNTTPRGGRPDRPSSDKVTPLEVTRMLLERGANPNMQLKLFPPYRSLGQDRGGDSMLTVGTTPLIRAAKAGDKEAVGLLLEFGALPDLPNSLGITPLMAAAGIGSTTIDIRARFRNEESCIETSRLLVGKGINLNAARDNGQTALHGAAIWGWNDYVRFLAAAGAQLDPKDATGSTPLDIANGKAGTTGRLGVAAPEPRPETAALLTQLIAASSTVTTPRKVK